MKAENLQKNFSQQVRTILVTKYHLFRGLFISHNCIFIFRNKGEILLFDLVLMFLRKEKSENIPVSTLNIYTVDTLLDQSFRLSIFSKVTNCGCLSVTSVQSVSECNKRWFFSSTGLFLKGVFSKPSGNYIVGPNLCFLSQRPQILATCLFSNFAELCKVSARLDNIDIRHFVRVPPLMFFDFAIYQKFNV